MHNTISPIKIAMTVMALAIIACSVGAPAPTATPVPTNTPVPPTDTPLPTSTPTDVPTPTATPNVAATQQAEAFQTLLAELKDKGYIETTEGTAIQLDDFSQDYSDVAHYNWWTVTDKPIGNFVLTGHFNWSTASNTDYIVAGSSLAYRIMTTSIESSSTSRGSSSPCGAAPTSTMLASHAVTDA